MKDNIINWLGTMTCFYFINKDSIYQQLYICGLLVFRVPELLVQEQPCSTSAGTDCIITRMLTATAAWLACVCI